MQNSSSNLSKFNTSIGILLIEDNESFSETTREYLNKYLDKPEIFIENNGKDGFNWFIENKDKVDIIVCDYNMPKWDGVETLKEIREVSEIPFILFTGKGSEEVASEAISAGASDYLQKGDEINSSNFEVLSNRIQQYIEKSKLVHEQEMLLERVDDAFFSYDSELQFRHLNRSGLELLSAAVGKRVSYEEAIGQHLWDFVPEGVVAELKNQFETALQTGDDVTFDFYYGEMDIWLETRIFPSKSGLSVFVQDVTEKKERVMQRELENELLFELHRISSDSSLSYEERLSEAVRIGREFFGLPFGFITEVSRGKQKIILTNCKYEHDLIFEGASCSVEQTYCQAVLNKEKLMAIGDVSNTDIISESKKDNFDFEAYASQRIMVEDELYGTLCFADIEPRINGFSDSDKAVLKMLTAWIAYEIEREEKKQQLETQNKRLEAFAEFVSHDLRNPLNVASGYLELEMNSQDDPSENLKKIQQSHTRMEELITELLDLSRSSEELSDTDEIVIRDIAETAWDNVKTNKSELIVKTELTIEGDMKKLLNVFENLFRNSVEHNNGRVTIEVGEFEDGFFIADNGTGISESVLDNLFKYGISGDSGNGLGLAITKEIINAHGWNIEINESWDGARFDINTK